MKRRRLYIVIALGLWSLFGKAVAQQEPEFGSRMIVVRQSDTLIYARLLVHQSKLKKPPHPQTWYMWHRHQRFYRTLGGYDGTLLHGAYTAYLGAEKRLLETGQYDFGRR